MFHNSLLNQFGLNLFNSKKGHFLWIAFLFLFFTFNLQAYALDEVITPHAPIVSQAFLDGLPINTGGYYVINIGQTVSINIVSDGSDGTVIDTENLPFTGKFNSDTSSSANYTFSPSTSDAGKTYAFNVISKTSSAKSEPLIISVSVINPNGGAINSPPNISVYDLSIRGDQYNSFNIFSAYDPDGDNISSFAASGLPNGLSIDPATGLVTGIVNCNENQKKLNSIQWSATDSKGAKNTVVSNLIILCGTDSSENQIPVTPPGPDISPTSTPIQTPTPDVSPTPTPVQIPTPDISPTPTPVQTPTPDISPTPTPVQTPTPDISPTPTPVQTPTPDASPTPELTPTPTPIPKELTENEINAIPIQAISLPEIPLRLLEMSDELINNNNIVVYNSEVTFSFSSSLVKKKLNQLFIDEEGLNSKILVIDSEKNQFLLNSKSYPLKGDSITIQSEKLPQEVKTGPATLVIFFNGLPTARFNIYISKLSLTDLVTSKPLKPLIDSVSISKNPFFLTAVIDGKNLYSKKVVVKDAIISTTSDQTVAQIITPGLKFLRGRIVPIDKNNLVKFRVFVTYEIINDEYKGPAIIVITTPYGQISQEITLE